ncbi:MAG: hypothetical protein H7330_00665 [Hymenobacteraceae bacterium]|nr:hypothetical protein [Hymenobacteraceae bacterium]
MRHISREADWLLAVNRGRTLRQRPPNPFDSFRREVLETIRGRDLREARRQVLEHLNAFKINLMLVVALQKWLNDEALVREHHLGIVEQ